MRDTERHKHSGLASAGPRRLCVAAAALLAFMIIVPADSLAGTGGVRDLGQLRIVGEIPKPPGPGVSDVGNVVYVDSARGRLYYTFTREGTERIAEYAIDRKIPRFVRESQPGPFRFGVPTSPYGWTLDSKRQRLIWLQKSIADGHAILHVFDLRSFKMVPAPEGEWEFINPDRLPGFYPQGFTYAAQDDRIYAVGSPLYTAYAQDLTPGAVPAMLGVIVALDPTDGSVEWARPLPECQQVLYEALKGSFIARSSLQNALYVACNASNAAIGTGNYPGHSGVLRVAIDPKGTAADALSFGADFFPISGRYYGGAYSGVAAFDAKTDRFFLQSLSISTPGAWVFDGRLSSWVGFIPARASGQPQYFGLNAKTGQYYMGGVEEGGFLVVTNARVTPIPQGNLYDSFFVSSFIYADEQANRLFVFGGDDAKPKWLVLEDRTPRFRVPEAADYDSLTKDIDEGSDTDVSFVSGVSGYGARASVVGGYGGVYSGVADPGGSASSEQLAQGRVRPADRAVTLANVPSVDVRAGTVSAAAQAASPDADTDSDLGALRQSVVAERLSFVIARQMRELARIDDGSTQALPPWWPYEAIDNAMEQGAQLAESGGPAENTSPLPETRQTASERLVWPWEPKSCLDGGGDKQHPEAEGFGGSVSLSCDAAGVTASAFARWGRFTDGPLSIASTSFDSRGWRDPGTGATTLVKAEADGIKIVLEGVGTLKIGHIESTVGTLAHGRPGTSKATWSSAIEQVRVLDAAGKPVGVPQACDDHASCQALADEITHALMGRIRVYVPEAHIEATEKGAFATVEKPDKDFLNDVTVNNDLSRAVPALQIEVYKDGIERSRILLQFAAIQANSIYTISPAAGALPDEPPAILPGAPLLPGPIAVGPPVIEGPKVIGRGPNRSSRGVFALLVRSPLEALHAAGIWILFGAAIVGVARRRTFTQQISQGDR
ncbi:MAG: hypothetical protein WAT66_02840 [Actinomycetota bacterium]